MDEPPRYEIAKVRRSSMYSMVDRATRELLHTDFSGTRYSLEAVNKIRAELGYPPIPPTDRLEGFSMLETLAEEDADAR